MSIVSACPHCNQRVSVADQHAGKQVRCPKCQQVFLAAPVVTVIASPAPEPKPVSRRRESSPQPAKPQPPKVRIPTGKTPMFWIVVACCGGFVLLLCGGGMLVVGLWLFRSPSDKVIAVAPAPGIPAAEQQAAKNVDAPPPINNQPPDVKSPKLAPKRKEPPPVKKQPVIDAELTDGVFSVQSKLGPPDFEDAVRQAWTKTYQVPVQAGGKYSVELLSDDFGVYLILQNPSDFEMAEDYDKGSAHKAHIDFTPMVSGPHHVIVTSVGRGRGDFTLTIRDLKTATGKDG